MILDITRSEKRLRQKNLNMAAKYESSKDFPKPAWRSRSADDRAYVAGVIRTHAAMIEDMDYDIGRVIQYLKNPGDYDKASNVFYTR